MSFLLGIQDIGQGNGAFLPAGFEFDFGSVSLLHLCESEHFIHIFGLHRLFQIFEYIQTIPLQGKFGAGGCKSDDDICVDLTDGTHGINTAHAVHIDIHKDHVKLSRMIFLKKGFATAKNGGFGRIFAHLYDLQESFLFHLTVFADGDAQNLFSFHNVCSPYNYVFPCI